MPKSEEKRTPRPGKRKKNQSLELLRAITKSMAGAVPGVSQETRDTIDDTLARPLSGLASQVMGSDPLTGETFFPPLENLKRSWGADERRKQGLPPQSKILPGMIPDTLSLPAQFSENAPQWSQDAKAVTEMTGGNIGDSMDLEPAQGFRQHALESAGIMGAQIPVAGPTKKAAEIGKGALHLAKKYGMKALKSPIEFLSPTIEPKMSNYLFGTAAGGALGSMGDETGEVAEEMLPPRALSRAKGGKITSFVEAAKRLRPAPPKPPMQYKYSAGDIVQGPGGRNWRIVKLDSMNDSPAYMILDIDLEKVFPVRESEIAHVFEGPKKAKGGKVGALRELLRAVSLNPDARAKQTAHQIGDPVEEVLYATNEGERKGVLSSAEAKRIKDLLVTGEEDELSDALLDLHSRLFPTTKVEPKLQKLPPLREPVFQNQAFREPVHGTGKLTTEEWDQSLQKKSKGGMIKKAFGFGSKNAKPQHRYNPRELGRQLAKQGMRSEDVDGFIREYTPGGSYARFVRQGYDETPTGPEPKWAKDQE